MPKFVGEGKIIIRNYESGHAMQFKNLVGENFNGHGRSEGVLEGTKVNILGEAVPYHHYDRLVTCFWDIDNEIHRNVNLDRG